MSQTEFERAYAALNAAQKQAVDTIDGPVLVIAGPGTGKTQLLGARVANILQQTDTPPQNILCLTFTESGAANMRERLSRFIGRQAYDASIGTYHSFGGDIIRRFPEYFTETNLEQPVDNLGKFQMVRSIVASMPYNNPLKQTQYHLRDLIETMSEAKRALLAPADLRAIAAENSEIFKRVNPEIAKIFEGLSSLPRTVPKLLPYYEQVFIALATHAPKKPYNERFGSLAGTALQQLQQAMADATEKNSTTPLTTWKNAWLEKSDTNTFTLSGALANRRIIALADVLEQYQAMLEKRGLYDFDDMILRTIEALETHDSLRFTLQEQYLYVLLDEFQDTNAAQLRLVELLTNNPLSDGRPNVMAVGDDDQAIYAFQGAQYSNMLDFYNLYRDVSVISLAENYRSHAAILETASNVTTQMSARLFSSFHGVTKDIIAKNSALPTSARIERVRATSDIAERRFVAERIQQLVDGGAEPSSIAVLAPKHRLLEQIVPYLHELSIPVQYEKRENILEAPMIRELITMAQLVLALKNGNDTLANALWPAVLSSPCWQLPVGVIWSLNWPVTDGAQKTSLTRELLEASDGLRAAGLLYVGLAQRADTEPLETMLDYLIGNRALDTNESDMPQVTSPFRAYYMEKPHASDHTQQFYECMSQLTVLRTRVREYQATQEKALHLTDFLALVDAHEAAEEPILHTSPYHQAANAVQLMTVYKAKGLEFDHVFLLSCQDEIWGGAGQSQSNRLAIPKNLAPIRHSGTTEDERLRLFFVAITRAKYGLYLTSHNATYNGKQTKPLKFLDERQDANGTLAAYALPQNHQQIIEHHTDKPSLATLELDWQGSHVLFTDQPALQNLLQERIANYQLSPTHLTRFIDLEYGGPQQFFMSSILRFPSAPTVDIQFGNAIHETLQWVQNSLAKSKQLPSDTEIADYFRERLTRRKLMEPEFLLQLDRGVRALAAYMKARRDTFKPDDKAEVNFAHQNAFLGDVHLGGAIDKLHIDTANKTIEVVDYKTGKSHTKWESSVKLHRYRRQLYCYKILVESSSLYAGYRVTAGRLDFVEPSLDDGKIHSLPVTFSDKETEETKQLLIALWNHVKALQFPDVSGYDASLTGVKRFEQDLISGKI